MHASRFSDEWLCSMWQDLALHRNGVHRFRERESEDDALICEHSGIWHTLKPGLECSARCSDISYANAAQSLWNAFSAALLIFYNAASYTLAFWTVILTHSQSLEQNNLCLRKQKTAKLWEWRNMLPKQIEVMFKDKAGWSGQETSSCKRRQKQTLAGDRHCNYRL